MIGDEEELSEEEKAAAAAWENMAEEGDGAAEGGEGPGLQPWCSTRARSTACWHQRRWRRGVAATSPRGIQAILSSALVSYERLPMLEIVFDRLVRMLSTSLRNFTSDNVEVSLDNITAIRFGDYLNSIPLPAMLGVFKAEEWDNYGLIMVDSTLTYSIVDVLLGGRRGTAAMRIEGRPYTTIERNLVEAPDRRGAERPHRDLRSALARVLPASNASRPIRASPRSPGPRMPRCWRACATIWKTAGGRIELLIPYATLEPVRELLLQMFMGEKFGRDSIWETHLSSEPLADRCRDRRGAGRDHAAFGRCPQLEAGSRLNLECAPDSEVELRCGDVQLFKGQMGRRAGKIAVKISDRLMK